MFNPLTLNTMVLPPPGVGERRTNRSVILQSVRCVTVQIKGDLQEQIMGTLWRSGSGTVEQVRAGLPRRYCGAYTTVQTVLNRLAERGLLVREKSGQAIVYSPTISESEYVSRELTRTLRSASVAARQSALAQLVGEFEEDLDELSRLARDTQMKRGGGE